VGRSRGLQSEILERSKSMSGRGVELRLDVGVELDAEAAELDEATSQLWQELLELDALSDGVSTSYWILTAIGIIVMVVALAGWVVTEDRKLKRQAAYLLKEGIAKTVHQELGGSN